MEKSSSLLVGTTLIAGLVVGFLLATALFMGEPGRALPVSVEVFHRVCTAVGGLGTLLALFYVIRQFGLLREQSALMQKNVLASLDGQVYGRLDSLNRLIVEHNTEYELLDTLKVGEEQAGHRAGLHHLCDMAFSFFEQIFKLHHRFELLNTSDWEEWRQRMAYFFGKSYVNGYWQTVRMRYDRNYREFADQLTRCAEVKRMD